MSRAASLWAHHVATEYRSSLVATELLHWLLQLGASPDTLARLHKIIADELRHAEQCFAVATAAGAAGPAPVPVEWTRLDREPDADLVHRAIAVVTAEYGVSETIAAAMFRRLKREPLRPDAAAVITRIARDEATHSAFGWFALEELLERAPDARPWLAARVPAMIRALRAQFEGVPEVAPPELRPWGVLDRREYLEVVDRAAARLVRPRLRALGVPVDDGRPGSAA